MAMRKDIKAIAFCESKTVGPIHVCHEISLQIGKLGDDVAAAKQIPPDMSNDKACFLPSP
jgi:hypothetical protein